jgi:pimeloyl-ACP methyl ester carboxylesterase
MALHYEGGDAVIILHEVFCMLDHDHGLGPVSCSFVSQRLRLHYLDWGNTSAPTLILLHGGRDHARSWDWTARALRADWHIIAPDMRGHGDSGWSPDGAYGMHDFVYDLAQMIHQLGNDQVTIVAHSLGGAVATRYAAIFPEKVRKLVTIEGMGGPPREMALRKSISMPQLWRNWAEERRSMAGRVPKRYPNFEAALERMQSENSFLSPQQARHLTLHGISRNEDGTYSWKFDNYLRSQPPITETEAEMQSLWANISCPVLLCHGRKSFASDPALDGRMSHYKDARLSYFDDAGHWLHHDQFDQFIKVVQDFI